MAEDRQDQSQKTEEPTARRLREARERGEVARSQEVNHWFMLLALALIVGFGLPYLVGGLGRDLLPFLERPHAFRLDGGGLQRLLFGLLGSVGLLLALPLGLAALAALSASLLQTGPLLTGEPLKPKLSKLSPLAGLKRLFGPRAWAEFAKGIAKIAAVGAIALLLLWPHRGALGELPDLPAEALLRLLRAEAFRMLIGMLAVMAVVAGLDYLFQRHEHLKRLRMSRQEIKDELKQSEGDPLAKARLRQLRLERARRRMMAAVPEADVVVTNPTHFAVALKYDAARMEAPRVVAKGLDHLALRIREVAAEHGVPLVENRPLARALYDSVELDREIPPQHYKAVAEVIGYVMRLGKKVGRKGIP